MDHDGPIRIHSRISSREIVLIVLFWTFLATLSAASRLLDPRGFGMMRMMGPGAPVAMAFVEAWMWAAFTPVIFWMCSRATAGPPSLAVRVVLLIAAGLLVAVCGYLLLAFAREELFEHMRRRPLPFRPIRDIARFRFVPQLLYVTAIVAAGFAREYFLRDRDRQAHASRLQAQLAEARLDALRMQINPHFLFNTLHAISALVERNPSGVRKMIARLSELLRHTTDARASDEIPLREELDFLRRYIEIMEVRFQGRLRVEQTIDAGALEALVPNLILQPLVENALEHGASRATGEGLVEIAARREAEALVVTVRDNGPGVSGVPQRGGIGLANTRARLEQMFGDAAAVTLTPAAGGGAVAELRLPFHTSGDLRAQGRGDD